MLSAQEYLDRVRSLAKCQESEFYTIEDQLEGLARCWDIEHQMRNLEAKRELFDQVPTNHPMFLKLPGWALFFTLKEAKAAIEDDDLMDSWVYDRAAGIVILNMKRGCHEGFIADLFQLYSSAPLEFTTMAQNERYAEQFVTGGHGFVLSSVARYPLKGKNVRLTPPEMRAFQNQRFTDLD